MDYRSKFITTTLPYSNGSAHAGHLLEFILADSINKFFKNYYGAETLFNTGFDEHGLKIQQSADKKGVSTQKYVDDIFLDWTKFINTCDIHPDSIYRTSDSSHKLKVSQFWNEAVDRGDIYKKNYKSKYCVGCESFKTDKEIVFNRCPDHPSRDVDVVEEENYFFNVKKYIGKLKDWSVNNEDFIKPKSKRKEFLNLVKDFEDFSISRPSSKVSWGIRVPGDETQTVYIWFEALLSYVFSAGYKHDDQQFGDNWTNSEVIQLCGPDNLKFQAVILQTLLISAEIKNTDKLLIHGTVLDEKGRKMSKSEGNVVDPIEQCEKYGEIAVRYYVLAGLNNYSNSSWDENRLVDLHNSHLADDYGNLISRVTHLASKGNKDHGLTYSEPENSDFVNNFVSGVKEVVELWDDFEINEALSKTNKLSKSINKYFGDNEPWKDLESNWGIINEVLYCTESLIDLYYPVLGSDFSAEIFDSIRNFNKKIFFKKIKL